MNYETLDVPTEDPVEIDVEFLVLHHTAATLERTLTVLRDPNRSISAHIIISADGRIIEAVPCLKGTCYQAAHTGRSQWDAGRHKWNYFDKFSIGIELENLNGNLFEYTDLQYERLAEVVTELKKLYPAINNPQRVLGHEQISGWRGKTDPGLKFDWGRFWQMNYPDQGAPERKAACPKELQVALYNMIMFKPAKDDPAYDQFWYALNTLAETSVSFMSGPEDV